MKTITYLADSHLRATTPSCRKDKDYYPLQMKKLEEAMNVLSEEEPIRLHGGDLFHVHNSPLSLIYDAAPLMLGKGLLVNAGNHDIGYANMETISRTGLGNLALHGTVGLLPPGVREFKDPSGYTIKIKSAPYMLSYPDDFYWIENRRDDEVWIILAHDMLVNHFVPFPHREIKDIKTNADLIFCSHWHKQFSEVINGTWFVNSGPIDAQTVTDKTRPAVAVARIDGPGQLRVDMEFLTTTGYEEIEMTEEAEKDLGLADDFTSAVKANDLADGATFQEAVMLVAKESGYKDAVIQRVLDRLQNAQTCAGRE